MNKPRILVVDDDASISNVVRIFLERTKRFEVREENRSSRALAAAREFLPDIVLLDVDMPGKDGGEVATEIGNDPTLREARIVFFTSLISPLESGDRPMMRGGRLYLAKPISSQVLIDTVDRVLGGMPVTA